MQEEKMKRMLISSLFFSCNECSEKEIKRNKKEKCQCLQKEKKWNEEWNKRKTKLKEREREKEREIKDARGKNIRTKESKDRKRRIQRIKKV